MNIYSSGPPLPTSNTVTNSPNPVLPYALHLAIALEAAEAASKVLLSMRQNPGELPRKADGTIITRADLTAEKAIYDTIRSYFPEGILKGHTTLFEETAHQPSPRQWIADPLDGTRNYVEKNGPWGTMVAFSVDNEVQVGVITLPEEQVTISVIKGGGVRLNGKAVIAPQIKPLHESIIYYDTYADRYKVDGQAHLKIYQPLVQSAQESRCSADTFYRLLKGEVSVALEYLTTPWDDAAGSLMLNELGGFALDFTGKLWTPKMVPVMNESVRVGNDSTGGMWGMEARNLVATFSPQHKDEFLKIVNS